MKNMSMKDPHLRESTLNNINANNNNELNFQRTSYSPLKEEKLELKYTPLNDHSSLLTPINQKKNIVVTKSSLNENDEQNNSPGIIKTHRQDRRKIGMMFQQNQGSDREGIVLEKINRSTISEFNPSKDLTMYNNDMNRWFAPNLKMKPKQKKLSKNGTNSRTLYNGSEVEQNTLDNVEEIEENKETNLQ